MLHFYVEQGVVPIFFCIDFSYTLRFEIFKISAISMKLSRCAAVGPAGGAALVQPRHKRIDLRLFLRCVLAGQREPVRHPDKLRPLFFVHF